MRRAIIFLSVLTSAIFFASIFGILHDQISYSISTEYYTEFKFNQFGLETFSNTPRLGAIVAGFLATWWVGIPIGIAFGLISTIGKLLSKLTIHITKIYLHIAVITLFLGLLGFLYGLLILDHDYYKIFWVPDSVTNVKRFVSVGMMHNLSYIGGLIGLIYGSIRLIVIKRKQ
jgi:LytS/YehU family sensor histidine kinase